MAVNAGILGATGYAGNELVRLLSGHPDVELTYLSSESYKGSEVAAVYPALSGIIDMSYRPLDISAVADACDVVFIAMPNGEAMKMTPSLLSAGVKVVDLGADFRFKDYRLYEEWYGITHLSPDLCAEAVYGLTEINRDRIAGASLVANPGCYPTSVLLPVTALTRLGLIDPAGMVIDAKSGVSGSGRALSLASHYCETNDSITAYKVGSHRHTPEIETGILETTGCDCTVTFTPHLTPMTRGILSTVYAETEAKSDEEILSALAEFYKESRFVRLRPAGNYPSTKSVYGSNYCDIGLKVDRRTGRMVIVSVIDNLVKGAAGQAVQNMNLMLGLPEERGLAASPLYP
ncbi:MAG: N-acetyl-gamma-glutamyl-phosphate reductase [bacterium]|nr:N-acetyl-gamma-glutamyl-phosphate reductase [bacterium]